MAVSITQDLSFILPPFVVALDLFVCHGFRWQKGLRYAWGLDTLGVEPHALHSRRQ
jgi:hypothetical protein